MQQAGADGQWSERDDAGAAFAQAPPRDYDPRACAGLYDTEARRFEYVRVEYDIESQRQKIIDAGLAHNFGTRLLLGI